MSNNLREKSRIQFENSTNSNENINTGSLQRIADACEIMASNYVALQKEVEGLKSAKEYFREERNRRDRKIIAMRGVITKLKNKLKQPKK